MNRIGMEIKSNEEDQEITTNGEKIEGERKIQNRVINEVKKVRQEK